MSLFTAPPKHLEKIRYKHTQAKRLSTNSSVNRPKNHHNNLLHPTSPSSCSKRRLTAGIVVFSVTLAVLSSMMATHSFTASLLESYYSEETPSFLFAPEGRMLQNQASNLRSNSMQETVAKLQQQQQQQQRVQVELPTRIPTRRSVVSHPTPVASNKKEVAWLMSFPNSGTSYTIHMTREASNCTTATNYALEGEIQDQPSVPAIPGQAGSNGPWQELIPNRHTTVPQTILTKTHCAGFCTDANCRNVHTARSFLMGCLAGSKAVRAKDGTLTKIHLRYDRALVKKAIHLFRHPLDNIVARFHLVYNTHKAQGDETFTKNFPKNQDGFRRWCAEEDKNKRIFESFFVDHPLRDSMKRIPCHNDFFRYVQWHNLAFTTTRDLNIPTMILHYDEYSTDLKSASNRVLNFLQLPRVGEVLEFHTGKEYRDYYTDEQKTNIRAFLQEFASWETWSQLKDYDFENSSLVAAAIE